MIIYVIGRAFPDIKTGMIGSFEFQQAKVLNDDMNEVHYIYFDNRALEGKKYVRTVEKTVDGVAVHGFEMHLAVRLPGTLFFLVKNFLFNRLIRKTIKQYGAPNVVHIHFPLISLTDGTWRFIKQYQLKTFVDRPICRLFVTEHWTAVKDNTLNTERKTLLEKIYNESDGFICVSEELRNSVIRMFGDEREIRVIPNMVSNYFQKASLVSHEGFMFAAVGRFVPLKRFNLLVDAFSKAFKGDSNIKLTIIGSGKLYDDIRNQVHNLGMKDQIILPGFKTSKEVSEILSASDCYVSSSELETFCVPAAEAWTLGLPCIVADNCPIKVYMKRENGCTFKVNDVDSLADAMMAIYNNHINYNHEEIRNEAINLFSEDAVKRQILDYYKESEYR